MKVNVQKLHYTKANEKKARVVPLILGGKKPKTLARDKESPS